MSKTVKMMLVLAITLSLVATVCQCGGNPAPQVGKPAPDFELPDLSGQSVSLGDLQGKPVLVNFWATWCGPCVYEMPYIQEVHDEWEGKDLVVLAINVGEGSSEVQQFMEDNNLSFPVLLDTNGKLAEIYSIRGIPTTIFIDMEGVIQAMKIGAFPSKAAIEENLSKIIP